MAVREAIVIGLPDQKYGEAPTAYIVLNEGHSPSDELKQELLDMVKRTLRINWYRFRKMSQPDISYFKRTLMSLSCSLVPVRNSTTSLTRKIYAITDRVVRLKKYYCDPIWVGSDFYYC